MTIQLDQTDRERTEGTTWHTVCEVADLEPEWGEAVLIDGRQIAVFRLWTDQVVAVAHHDPRTGSPVMARGIVGTRQGCPTIASPLHKESYSLLTGECFTNPDLHLEVFPTKIENGQLLIAY